MVSPNENNRRTAALRKLASAVPASGSSVLIVSHKPNIIDAFGKDWFEVKEGEATILKPDGTWRVCRWTNGLGSRQPRDSKAMIALLLCRRASL